MADTTYHNIDQQGERIVLRTKVWQEEKDPGYWVVILEVRGNTIGDINLFVINNALDKFLGTASPMQEDGVPSEPLTNEQGEQRLAAISFRHRTIELIDDAIEGVKNDFDEYLRSKIIYRDEMNKKSRYTFSKED